MDELSSLSDKPMNPGNNAVTVGSLSQDFQRDEGQKNDEGNSAQHGVIHVDTSIPDQNQFQEQLKEAVSSVSEITIDENLRVLKSFSTTHKVEAVTGGEEISSDDRTSDSYKMKIVFDLSRKSHPTSADGLLPTPDCPQVKITRLASDSSIRQYTESTVRSDSQTRKLKRKTKDSNVTFSQDIPDYKGYESIEDVLSFINGKVTKEEKSIKTCEKTGAGRSKRENKERSKQDENSEDNSDRENVETVGFGTRMPENMHAYCTQDLKPDLSISMATTADVRSTVLAGGLPQVGTRNFISHSVEEEPMETVTTARAPIALRRDQHKELLFVHRAGMPDDVETESDGVHNLTPPPPISSPLLLPSPRVIHASQVFTNRDQGLAFGEEVLKSDRSECPKSTSLPDVTDNWIACMKRGLPGMNRDTSAHARGASVNVSEVLVRPSLHEPSAASSCFPPGFPPERLDALQKASDHGNHQPRGRRNYRGGWMDTGHHRMPAFQQSWGPRLPGQDFTHGWHQGLRFPGQGVAAEHLAVPFPAVLHPHRMQTLQQTLMPVPAAPLGWKKWRTPVHQENRNADQRIAAQEEKPTSNAEHSKKKKRNTRRNGKEQSKKEDAGMTESTGASAHLDRGDSGYRPQLVDDGVPCDVDLVKCFKPTIRNCSGSVTVLNKKNEDSTPAKSVPFKKPMQTLKKCSRKPVYVHDKRIEEIEPLDIGIVFGWDPSLEDCQSHAGSNTPERELRQEETIFGSAGFQVQTTVSPTAGTGILGGGDTTASHAQPSSQLGRSVSCNMQAEPVPTSSNTSTDDGAPSVCESRSDSAISFSALANEGLVLVQYGSKVPLREGETLESRRIYYQHIPDGPYNRKVVEEVAASMTSLWELATSGSGRNFDPSTGSPTFQRL